MKGTKPTKKEGTIITPIVAKCNSKAPSIVKPCARNLRSFLRRKPPKTKSNTLICISKVSVLISR